MSLNNKGFIDTYLVIALVIVLGVGGSVILRIKDTSKKVAQNAILTTANESTDKSNIVSNKNIAANDNKVVEEIVKIPTDGDISNPTTDTQRAMFDGWSSTTTYRDDVAGFTFEYPDNGMWDIVRRDAIYDEEILNYLEISYKCGFECGAIMRVSVYKGAKDKQLEVIRNTAELDKEYEVYEDAESYIGNVLATRIIYTPVDNSNFALSSYTVFVAENNGNTYVITINPERKTNPEFDIVNQGYHFIDLFRFI